MLARFTGSTSIILDSRSLTPSDSGTCNGNVNCPAQHPAHDSMSLRSRVSGCVSHMRVQAFNPLPLLGLCCRVCRNCHHTLHMLNLSSACLESSCAGRPLRCGVESASNQNLFVTHCQSLALCFEACLRTPHMPSVDSYTTASLFCRFKISSRRACTALRCVLLAAPVIVNPDVSSCRTATALCADPLPTPRSTSCVTLCRTPHHIAVHEEALRCGAEHTLHSALARSHLSRFLAQRQILRVVKLQQANKYMLHRIQRLTGSLQRLS